MFKFTLNGPNAPLGSINTGLDFTLTNFPDDQITFSIKAKGPHPITKTVTVNDIIKEALNYIDSRCANNKNCNDYFEGLNTINPVTLRRILDEKNLQIFRLGGKEDKDLYAGYTHGWGQLMRRSGSIESHLLTLEMRRQFCCTN
jgi:hypothetical protein